MRVSWVLLAVAATCMAPRVTADPAGAKVHVDWSAPTATSHSSTTIQVVSNSILDRTFTVNNKTFVNPIHDNIFESLSQLGSNFTRFVPWFPLPHLAVAELDAPVDGKPTSWNFTYVIPQFQDFMSATHMHGRSTVINFSTQPCWLYKQAGTPGPQDCSYPANPDVTDFGYVRGNALVDPTATQLANYYGRLLSYFMKGEMTDEQGVVHKNDPSSTYPNMTYWEVFNEAEHGYTQEWYVHDYDKVVAAIREQADPEHRLKFVGVGGASRSWIPYFVNKSNHAPGTPLDFVSIHFYANTPRRSDPTSYVNFFADADGFIHEMLTTWVPFRDSTAPDIKLDLDELGVILPGDNNPGQPLNATIPRPYWNAAGSMYAYLYMNLAPAGVDVLGHSQLAGNPNISEYGIPLPQYPSVSLIDWRTGWGNARYWVTYLLIHHFGQAGDVFYNTTVTSAPPASGSNPFCGTVVGPNYGSVALECVDPDSVINGFDFVDWGTPSGSCGSWQADAKCTDVAKATAYAESMCLNKTQCTLIPYPTLGDPCLNVLKTFAVQARCSGPHGGAAVQAVNDVAALGATSPGTGQKKILLVNKTYANQVVTFDAPISGTAFSVDSRVDPQGAKDGIFTESLSSASSITMLPFATTVIELAN